MKKICRGILISVEGIDGSGKTTLVGNLVQRLQELDYPASGTREPGATQLGTIIRGIVQQKEIPRTAKAEYLLFAADRAQHFHEVVIPALKQSKIVISDRMIDSSLVYQGYARGLELSILSMINAWTMNGYTLDYTLYLKLDAQTAVKRLQARGQALTVFEEKIAFTEKLIAGFDTLFADNSRSTTLDARLTEDELATIASQEIIRWIEKKQLLCS